MTRDLHTLIDELELEKNNLLHLIDNSVEAREYLFAHFHFEALQQVNRQLHTLKSLGDNLYDEKDSLMLRIESLKGSLEKETSDHLREFMSRMVEEVQRELQRLSSSPKKQKQERGSQVLDNYLEMLLGRRIRIFRINLIKEVNFIVEIKRIKGTIRITIPHVKRLMKISILDNEKINKFKSLGFQFTPRGDKLMKSMSGDTWELSQDIKTLLAIVVFEIFYFKEFDRNTYIEIKESNR